ncbi:MAG: type II secretion system protein [Solirubrobacterales bacterium]
MRWLCSGRCESGFTLIELLVVMLILGVLAAIAIPAFLSQKEKADDSKAKVEVRTMATAIETCRTENEDGDYDGCDGDRLMAIEPTIPAAAEVLESAGNTYEVESAPAESTGNLFRIKREDGEITRSCEIGAAGKAGGCNTAADDPVPGADGTW